MSHPEDLLKHLPARLRTARRNRGLSLESLAQRSGVSRSMVSQIERGESSPTIATLLRLTRALELDLGEMLSAPPAKTMLRRHRGEELPRIASAREGYSLRVLSPLKDDRIAEVYELTLDPGGCLRSRPHRKGTREDLTVLRGQVDVTAGDHSDTATASDVMRYDADVPHEIAAGPEGAQALLVVRGPLKPGQAP